MKDGAKGRRFLQHLALSGSERYLDAVSFFRASELHEMGLVDVLAEDGQGEQAIGDFIKRSVRKRNGMQAVFKARQHFSPLSYDELISITKIWVDAAMRLEDRDIKIMGRVARAQLRRHHQDAPTQEQGLMAEAA